MPSGFAKREQGAIEGYITIRRLGAKAALLSSRCVARGRVDAAAAAQEQAEGKETTEKDLAAAGAAASFALQCAKLGFRAQRFADSLR